MNTGIHDAANLGWKLAATVRGRAPAGLLDTYHDERHPAGERMCWHAQASMSLLHPLEKVRELRELMGKFLQFEDATRHLLRLTTDVRYPMGEPDAGPVGGQVTEGHPLLGRHLSDTPLMTAGGPDAVARLLRTGRGLLLDLSGGTDLSGLAGWADRVGIAQVKPGDDSPAVAVLVRPDGYVAPTGPDGTDRAGLRRALARWFGDPAETVAAAGPA